MAKVMIQDAANKVLSDWDEYCKPRGAFITEKVGYFSESHSISGDMANTLLTLCALNVRLGTTLNLFLLKLGNLGPDSPITKGLFAGYRDIEEEMTKEYLRNLDKLTKQLKSEPSFVDLSEEVKALVAGLKKIQKAIKRMRSTIKSYEKKK